MAKPPRSEAQRAASRANGRKSNGPRTRAGKRRSRCNAMKHGLRAGSLAVLATGPEAPGLSLAETLCQRLAPTDPLEQELAEGIALAFWRLRRARELEELLLEGRDEATAKGLGRFLLRRGQPTETLALLLRYRNQALLELGRLRRLLDEHRRPAAAGAADGQAPGATSDRGPQPANDNRTTERGRAGPQPGQGVD